MYMHGYDQGSQKSAVILCSFFSSYYLLCISTEQFDLEEGQSLPQGSGRAWNWMMRLGRMTAPTEGLGTSPASLNMVSVYIGINVQLHVTSLIPRPPLAAFFFTIMERKHVLFFSQLKKTVRGGLGTRLALFPGSTCTPQLLLHSASC